MLTLLAPCTILVNSLTTSKRLRELAEQFQSDATDPVEFKCVRCGCAWERCVSNDYNTVTCSNCYSERVIITIVRLGFENWGEQNGGEKEQRARYEKAGREVSAAMKALAKLKDKLPLSSSL